MRLLNTETLQVKEFFGFLPPYAILSHTWEKEEVLFSDMQNVSLAHQKAGFVKLQAACQLALKQGYHWIWIDTSCIDKSSSAELSEAINSMYRWYAESAVCYAYLCDVEYHRLDDIQNSRWFTRGWTLQELIAPTRVEFYDKRWVYIGEKHDDILRSILSQASLVDECVLAGVVSLDRISVARKMYWASRRYTTRKEDEAYCLLGIFDVNMPLLYGEGKKAFIRLQQEIMKATDDQSVLAWYCFDPEELKAMRRNFTNTLPTVLATSPRCFARSKDIWPLTSLFFDPPEKRLRNMDCVGGAVEFSALIDKKSMAGDSRAPELRRVLLNCQMGQIPGTLPIILVDEASGTRYMKPNEVTSTNIYLEVKEKAPPLGVFPESSNPALIISRNALDDRRQSPKVFKEELIEKNDDSYGGEYHSLD
jgi:Heterokaryon incompatibility protein (HET).